MEVPTRSASSDEEEIGWGAALPPLSPPSCGLLSASGHDSLVDRALGR
jgi:hypothetical protein